MRRSTMTNASLIMRQKASKEKKQIKALPWLILKLAGYAGILIMLYAWIFSGLFS